MFFSNIGLVSDHAGLSLCSQLQTHLDSVGLNYCVMNDPEKKSKKIDYPDTGSKLARAISTHDLDGGIAICGTGIGMSIVANKYLHVRAASIWDPTTARLSREHNDLNCLCLGARCLSLELAIKIVDEWLKTPFSGERHQARLNKIRRLEELNFIAPA